MLSRDAFDRYDRQVRNLADGAEDYTRRMLDAYMGQNPDASVEQCREFAREVMAEAVRIYGDAAATAAADYYDAAMEASGNGAPRALLSNAVDPVQVEKVARYQAGKLASGDVKGFVKECAAYVGDSAKRAANDTTLRNAQRDGRRGVRYARVPTGAETCTFCRMLASRGFVYKSDKSAGQFNHFHRGCDCRIVASADDEGLEGYDPGHEYELYQEFRDIEEGDGTQAEKRARMQAVLEESGDGNWRVAAARRKVDESLIASKTYRARVEGAAGEKPPIDFYADAVRMLRHRSGTAFEDRYAYDLDTGKRIGSVVNSTVPKRVEPGGELSTAISESVKSGHGVAMLHNHPDSSMPSVSDLAALKATGATYGVIACHDGTVYRYELVDDRYDGYTRDELEYDLQRALKSFHTRLSRGKSETDALAALENDWGVKVEHLL